jgi:hypothetical protein
MNVKPADRMQYVRAVLAAHEVPRQRPARSPQELAGELVRAIDEAWRHFSRTRMVDEHGGKFWAALDGLWGVSHRTQHVGDLLEATAAARRAIGEPKEFDAGGYSVLAGVYHAAHQLGGALEGRAA